MEHFDLGMRELRRVAIFVILGANVALACFALSPPAHAVQSIPYKMNFQGRLGDASGMPMVPGNYNMRFRIYDAASGGTLLWSEQRANSASTGVAVTSGGLFSVQLGDVVGLPPGIFNNASAIYFEIELPTPATATCTGASCESYTEGPMTPRNPLGSSAYAFNSDTLDGLDSAAFAQVGSNTTFTGTLGVNVSHVAAFTVGASGTDILAVNTAAGLIKVGAADSTAQVFVLDNNTADPGVGVTSTNGAMYYNSTSGKFRCHQAGVWADCITPAGGGATLQTAYDGSGSPATITTTAAKGVSIVAGAPPTTNLFTVDNTANPTVTDNTNAIAVRYAGGGALAEGSGIRLEYTPGTTSAGVWSGMRIVAGATGAAAGVNSYGAKIEGPTSPGAGSEVGLSIGTGWDVGADIQSGGLQLSAMSDPTTPAAGNLRVYTKLIAGRAMLKAKAPSGVEYAYQPALFQQQVTMATPGITATTITGIGNGIPVLSGKGAAAVTTQAQGAMNRITSSTTAGTGAGVQTTTVGYYRGTGGTNADGFFYYARLNFAETALANYTSATTGMRFFAGLSSLGITGAGGMSSSNSPAGHYAGFSYSAVRDTSGEIQFMTNNNATPSIISTGVVLAIAKTYDFTVYSAPGAATLYWRIANLTDGTTTEGSTAAALPSATTPLRTGFSFAPLSTTARFIHWQRLYTESDR
jgi:hypothetical protein